MKPTIMSLAVLFISLPPFMAFSQSDDKKPKEKPPARSWPMFGGSPSRNMVNTIERNLPADWSIAKGKLKNIKWVADLRSGGNRPFGNPVVADGRVFTGSNRHWHSNVGVMMAFREEDGKLLWENAHKHPPKFESGWSYRGTPSAATIDGNRLYYIAPPCEIICADCDTGKINWRYDMVKELKVFPSPGTFWSTPPLGSPLVFGDLLFAITGNGCDDPGKLIAPRAPSFVALHKKTGKLAWQSNLPGENIIEGQWSSPALALVNGSPQVIFAGGDCVIYSFAPETGKLLWKCDCLPVRKGDAERVDNYIVGTPVVVGDRLYVGLGVTAEHARPPSSSYFLCLDITKKGDVSLKSYDAKDVRNKGSALVWAFGGLVNPPPKGNEGRRSHFHGTNGTPAVRDGLVYITELYGYLHCLDAATGRPVWEHNFLSEILGSPYLVDGRVFVGTGDGEVVVFAHGRTAKVLATINMDEVIHTTPIAANGVLYVATRTKLFAIGPR